MPWFKAECAKEKCTFWDSFWAKDQNEAEDQAREVHRENFGLCDDGQKVELDVLRTDPPPPVDADQADFDFEADENEDPTL